MEKGKGNDEGRRECGRVGEDIKEKWGRNKGKKEKVKERKWGRKRE